MKCRFGILLALTLIAMPLAAQSNELGLWLSQSRVGETDADEALLEFDNGDGYGVSFNHFFSKAVSTEFSVTLLSQDGTISDDEIAFDVGSLDIMPIIGTVQLHFARGGRVSPYVGAGVAYIMADDLSSADLDDVELGNIEVDDAVTWAAQAGLDINISERFAIGIDAKYTGYTPDAAPADAADDSLELDLNPLILSAGLKFRW